MTMMIGSDNTRSRKLRFRTGPWFLLVLAVVVNSSAHAQSNKGRLSESASFDCVKVAANPSSSIVARILCSGKDGAAADWDVNSALASHVGINNERDRKLWTKSRTDGGRC